MLHEIQVASQNSEPKPATGARFKFLNSNGDKKGTMNINYKEAKIKKGKKWFIEYYYRNPNTGKLERFKVYENINRYKGDEQERYALLLQKAVNHGLKTGWNPFDTPELEVAVKNWTLIQGFNFFKQNLVKRGLKQRTVETYQSVLRVFCKEFAPLNNNNIKEITKTQIRQILLNAKEKKKWTNTTFNKYVTFLRSIFSYLIEEESGILEHNPATRIKMLQETITRHKYFSEETFKKIKENAPPELLRFMMFLYHTGIRPNEARQLKYENIIRERRLLFVPATISKNKKDGYVPLSDYVLNNYQGEGFIFNTTVDHYGKMFKKLKRNLKLPENSTLYAIKHSRALHLAQDGADPYTIMQLFRHSGLHITMSYLRELGINDNHEVFEKGIKF